MIHSQKQTRIRNQLAEKKKVSFRLFNLRVKADANNSNRQRYSKNLRYPFSIQGKPQKINQKLITLRR
jgi:hypothetical protein